MPDILHRLGIRSSPGKVYQAPSEGAGAKAGPFSRTSVSAGFKVRRRKSGGQANGANQASDRHRS